jgi:hypothetical protein
MSAELLKAIAVTAELTGTELTKAGLQVMEADLAKYPADKVFEALTRCRHELTGRLSLASIIDRIDDGRPKADEAWGIALQSMADEGATVVINDDISEAIAASRPIYEEGDEVGARMAFRATYERVTRDRKGLPVNWWPSLGTDPNRREHVLLEAVVKGRLGESQAYGLLPPPKENQLLFGNAVQLISNNGTLTDAGKHKQRIQAARDALKKKSAA